MADRTHFFSPHFLVREAGLAYEAVAALGMEQTVAALAEVERLEAQLRADAEPLCATIYGLVPQVDESERRTLISVQRDLFNLRPVAAAARAHTARYLDAPARQVLDAWCALYETYARLNQSLEEIFERELATKRVRFASLLGELEFQKGVQLSGNMLLDKVLDYQRAIQRGKLDKQLRKAEIPLASYLSRMALKPTPFGSFTSIRLGFLGASPAPLSSPDSRPLRGLVRLARLMLLGLEKALVDRAELRPYLFVRQNHTCELRDGTLHYFTRGRDASLEMFRSESFKRLPASDTLRIILDIVEQEQPCRYGQMVERVIQLGPPRADAQRYLDRLAEIGLMEISLGIPDQEIDFLGALHARLVAIPEPLARQVAAEVERAIALERAFTNASAGERVAITKQVLGIFEELARTLEAPAAAPTGLRTIFYEDTAIHPPPMTMEPAALAPAMRPLGLIQRLLPLFSETLLKQLALVRLFERRHPDKTATPGLLDFYEFYSQVPTEEMNALLHDRSAPEIQAVRALQDRFMSYLDELVRTSEGKDEIVLDEGRIEELVEQIPPHVLPWESVAYRCQLDRDTEGQTGLILNAAGMGFAKLYSRFCDLFNPETHVREGNPMIESIRALNAELPQDRIYADLIAVFGINVNLHPRLLDTEVLYPRSMAAPGSADVLTLRDLSVILDERCRCLRLFSNRHGKVVILVPHNFLFPLAGPRLYQFLYRFGPSAGSQIAFWDRYHEYGNRRSSELRVLPRLRLGNVIIDRATWKVPPHLAPPERASHKSDLEHFRAMRQWQRQLGLPDEGFVRVRTLPDPFGDMATRWKGEEGNWLDSLRQPRERKPQYVDFRNFFLIKIFDKHIRDIKSDFTFQEFLPGSAALAESGGRAQEYAFELNAFDTSRFPSPGGAT